jgi:glycosyltransferase involved in cell wall biosynthesis
MRLSVVVPTFNEALHIEDTVSAALCIGDEVIVADGGSADETAELAAFCAYPCTNSLYMGNRPRPLQPGSSALGTRQALPRCTKVW